MTIIYNYKEIHDLDNYDYLDDYIPEFTTLNDITKYCNIKFKDYDQQNETKYIAIFNGLSVEIDNDVDIMIIYALYFRLIQKNPEQCIKYYQMAIDSGHYKYLIDLGYYYYYINDYEKSCECFNNAINKNIYNALIAIGWFYNKFYKNTEKMKEYYLKAYKEHNLYEGMNNLGEFYINNKEYNKAIKCYKTIIDKYNITIFNNNPEFKEYYLLSCSSMGDYYQDIEHNYDKMKLYYLLGIDHQDNICMNNLGYYYQHVEKNYNMAIKYYKLGIALNDTLCMNNLGNYYEKIKDYPMMSKYYLMGIEHGCKYCMDDLAYYYDKNEQYEQMIKYYLMAIKRGHDGSMYRLGIYYAKNSDYKQMEKYFLMAINKGNTNAMIQLSNYMEYLDNYNEPYKYYIMAIKKGYNINNIILTEEQWFHIYHLMKYNNDSQNDDYSSEQYQQQLENIVMQCPHLIYEFEGRRTIYGNDKGDCYICLDKNKPVISWPCHKTHTVCYNCYLDTKNTNKCGVCRAIII